MRLSEMKESNYGIRLYKMPSDEVIAREAKWGGGNFADLKRGYEVLWGPRRSLHKASGV
jgi:hypothetical protein